MKYFYYHPYEGFRLCKDEKEAKDSAQFALDFERSMAQSEYEWMDCVEDICWGEVKQSVKAIEIDSPEIDGRIAADFVLDDI